MNKMQPMETAPKTETQILLLCKDMKFWVAGWRKIYNQWWNYTVYVGESHQFIGWFPLPCIEDLCEAKAYKAGKRARAAIEKEGKYLRNPHFFGSAEYDLWHKGCSEEVEQ